MAGTYYRDGKDGLVVVCVGHEPACSGDLVREDGVLKVRNGAQHEWSWLGKFARCKRCAVIWHDGARLEIVAPKKRKPKQRSMF